MIFRIYYALFFIFSVLFSDNLRAATRTSLLSGNWDSFLTWDCLCVPTAADNVVINDNVTIASGNPVTISSITINSGGTLTVQDGLTFTGILTVNGTITFSATSGTMNFNEIIINSSGVWNTVSSFNPMISGSFTNNGSFNAGSGTYTFTSSNGSGIIGGSNYISIYMLSFNSGAQYTNNGIIYVNTINGAGSLTQGTNSYLRISNIISLMTLNAGTNQNVVEYNGSAQTIRATSYWDLLLSGSTATLGGATSIVSDLKLYNGILNTGTFQITTNPGDSILMKPGTTFNVGSTASSQPVDFPFFNAYQLDNSSTVIYQGNYNQQVLASYSNLAYGNLSLTTGAASVVKTLTGILPSPFSLTVNGSLNLPSSKVNFNIGDDAVSVGGDVQGIGMIQIASGILNIKGNFSNTGGFNAGTGTVNYNGSVNQNIRNVSYWNLILSGSGVKTLLGSTAIGGNLTISGSAQLDVSASSFSLIMSGSNWIVNTTADDPFIERSCLVSFLDNDGLPDTIGGNDTLTFYDLAINQVNKSGFVLTTPVMVIDSMSPVSGIVRTSAGSELLISSQAKTAEGNDSSFIDGPVIKYGAADFIFPTGAGNTWAPVGISSMSGDDNTLFTAQYFKNGFGTYPVSFLDHVSEFEYWKVERSGTLTPASVTLYWKDQTESRINDYANLTVARYNGTSWVDEGRSAMDSANPGSVTSFAVSNFSPFTFGSYAGGGSNPFFFANTITVDSLSDNAFCPGENVVIWFSAAGSFSNGNVFYAELSDTAGSFASPDTIGTLAAMLPGIIIGTIPAVPSGSGYRIRVVSTAPPVTGMDNGSNIIISPSGSMDAAVAVSDVSCAGYSDGYIDISLSGASPPVTFVWSEGSTTEDINFLVADTYSVMVADSIGCTLDTTVVINQPAPLNSSIVALPVSCNGGSNGSIDLVPAGGTTPYSFSWTGGYTSEDIDSLIAGTYTVSVTDANSCALTIPITITEPTVLAMTTAATFDYDSCNGTATVSASGGTAPYDFLWDDPSTSTNDTVTGLCGGLYHITVTDNNSCTTTDSAEVITAIVSFTADTTGGCAPITVNFTNTSNLGVSGVTYLWYFVSSLVSDGPYFIYEMPYSFNYGGQFIVYLFAVDTDVNVLGGDTMIMNFSGSSGYFSVTDDTVCPGDNIIVFDEANISSYYNWNFGDGYYQNGTDNLTTHAWASPGTYNVSLAINTACGPDTIIKPVVISNLSSSLGAMQLAPQPVCPGDNLQIAAFGSAGNFTWDFGDGITGYSGVPYTVHAYSGPGNYILTMTLTDGCGSVLTTQDTVTVAGGVPISGNFELTTNPNPVCPGDMVKFKFEEGEHFSSYDWEFGDGNAASGSATQYHSYSLTGNYTVSVTVTNGCGSSTVVTVPVSVQNGVTALIEEYSFGVIPNNACPGDSVIFYIDGITGGGYVWDFGDGVTDSNYTPMDSSAIIRHAYSDTGIYQATIIITNGCGSSATGTMTVWVSNSFAVVPSWWGEGFTWEGRNNGPSQTCSDVTFFAFSGSIFKWNFGDGDSVQTVSTSVDHMYTSAGTYTVSLEVTNSCSNSKQFLSNITVTGSCLPPSATDTSSPPRCNGGNDGWIQVTAAGGILPYTFQWSNGESAVDTLQSLIDSLTAGTYILTLTDGAGSILTDTVVLAQPLALTMASSVSDVTCNDTCDGTLSVTAAGGTPPYGYLWSSGDVSASINALCIGNYTVTVTDSLNCSLSQNFTVAGVPGFFADLASTPDTDWISPATVRNGLCCTATTPDVCVHFLINTNPLADRIFININSGAVPPGSNYYLDNCDPASTTMLGDTLCLTSAGMHNVTYCKPGNNINDYIIGTRQRPVVNAGNDVTVCPGVDTIALSSTGSGASSYLWLSSGSGLFYPSSMVINPVYLPTSADKASGSVELVLVGTGTCTNVKDTMLIQFSAPVVLSASSTPECEPNTGVASVSATGGTPPYTYVWSNGETQSAIYNLQFAIYTVTVSDVTGCTASVVSTVESGVAFNAAITALINPSCNGGSDGTATAIASNIPSQSFSTSPNALIPDGGCSTFNGVNSIITVSGYSALVNSSGIKVTLNINHTFDADLQIFLAAPNGNTLMLSTGNGGSGDNFINTVFTDGAPGSITMGTPPFTGIFKPEGGMTVSCGVTPTITSFGAIGGGTINPNGNWSLRVFDNISIDTGIVVSWSLTIPPVPVTGAAFSYQWNDASSQTDSIATGLAAGTYDVIITDTVGCDDTAIVTLIAPPANTGSQALMICSGDSIQLPDLSWVSVAGTYTDTVTSGGGCDSIVTTTLTVLPYATFNNSIYYEHFESGNAGWYGGGINSSWQLGAPSATFINDAASGVNAWVTNLTGNYNVNENSFITSPCFDMSAFVTDPTLRFSHIFNIEKTFDRHWVSVSADGGGTWTKLGAAGTGVNWYNNPVTNSWDSVSGSAGGWNMAEHELTGTAGQTSVMIRFVLSSDFFIEQEGAGVDDLYIGPLPLADAGVSKVLQPLTGCNDSSVNVSLVIKNFGYGNIVNIPVSYSVNGSAPVTENATLNILPGDSFVYTFTYTENFSMPGTYIVDAWTSLPADSFPLNNNISGYVFQTAPGCCVPDVPYGCGLDYIDGVVFDAITNSSTGCNGNPNGYIYYYSDTASVTKGTTVPIQITPTSTFPEGIGVWIDFNQNNSFGDAGEFVFSAAPGYVTVTGNINIPLTAQLGLTYLRVMAIYNATPVATDYCDSVMYGETEDYPVMILPVTTALDVGVIEIFNPGSYCSLSSAETVSVKIKNFGTDSVNLIPVRYRVNGGLAVSDLVNASIGPGDTLMYDFTNTYDFSADGIYSIDAWTAKALDYDPSNDSTLNVIVENFTDLSVTALTKNATCGDVNNGAIFLDFTSGISPFIGSWTSASGSGSDTLYASDTLIKKVAPGQYNILLTDANGCIDSVTAVISAPPLIVSSWQVTDVSCGGYSDGAINLTVTGGYFPWGGYAWAKLPDTVNVYSYSQDLVNIPAGWYAAYIVDTAGCDDTTGIIFVSEPLPIVVSFAATPDSCSPSCEGTATASVTNGIPPLTYLWSNGSTGLSAGGLCGGYASITVTDSTNCVKQDSISIPTLNIPSPVVASSFNYCLGDVIDTIKAAPQSGGTLLWYVTPPPSGIPLDSGNLFLPAIVTGTNWFYVTERTVLCESPTSDIEINLYELPPAEAGSDITICLGERTQLIASGGITYLWKPPVGLSDTTIFNPVAKPSDTTEYFVRVADVNNCTALDSVTVFVDATDNCWHVYNMFSPNNDGSNDVWIIDGIVRFPENKVTIYNRFEDKVKELINYDNINVVWRGESNGNEPLPGGTYFYVIDVGEKKSSGWVQIIR